MDKVDHTDSNKIDSEIPDPPKITKQCNLSDLHVPEGQWLLLGGR